MISIIYKRIKFWITDFFSGTHMYSDYRQIRRHMRYHTQQIPKFRDKKLKEILIFAKNHVPYYHSLKLDDSLKSFPIVNKATYREFYKEFCVPEGLIPGQKGPLHIQKTSGSTGTPFEVRQDTKCRVRRIATIKAENELLKFHSFEPLMHLRAAAHYWGEGEDIHFNEYLNIWYVDNANLNDTKIGKIVSTIQDHRIKVVRGYVTCLESIVDFMIKNNLKFNHKVSFIPGGELLIDSVRDKFLKLGCDVISQYANEENGVFGSSDINGSGRKINLNGANCYVEILKFDSDEPVKKGELGRIVVTDFTNFAFPMIRYDIGDAASPCEFYDDGSIKVIDNLVGRKTDIILKTDGTKIDIFNSIPSLVYNNPSVIQWQFIQKGEKDYLLILAVTEPLSEGIEKNILEQLHNLLGCDGKINIHYTSEIPVLQSGKRKVVINEWNGSK